MKIRTDIAALLREGHSDTSVAHRLGCHRATVHRVRQALRFYTEAFPAGGFSGPAPSRLPVSPDRAAANRAELLAALDGVTVGRHVRHLHVAPESPTTAVCPPLPRKAVS